MAGQCFGCTFKKRYLSCPKSLMHFVKYEADAVVCIIVINEEGNAKIITDRAEHADR